MAEASSLDAPRPQQLYKESLKNLILRLLAEKPRHGYEIIKSVERITKGKWKPAAGTLYPILDKMSREGLIEVYRVESEGVKGGRRVIYKLTERGWRELIRILESSVDYKFDFLRYYLIDACRILEANGYSEDARKLCSRRCEAVRRLEESLKGSCSGAARGG